MLLKASHRFVYLANLMSDLLDYFSIEAVKLLHSEDNITLFLEINSAFEDQRFSIF